MESSDKCKNEAGHGYYWKAAAKARSDMNAAVNMETSWRKSLEILPKFIINEIQQHS